MKICGSVNVDAVLVHNWRWTSRRDLMLQWRKRYYPRVIFTVTLYTESIGLVTGYAYKLGGCKLENCFWLWARLLHLVGKLWISSCWGNKWIFSDNPCAFATITQTPPRESQENNTRVIAALVLCQEKTEGGRGWCWIQSHVFPYNPPAVPATHAINSCFVVIEYVDQPERAFV